MEGNLDQGQAHSPFLGLTAADHSNDYGENEPKTASVFHSNRLMKMPDMEELPTFAVKVSNDTAAGFRKSKSSGDMMALLIKQRAQEGSDQQYIASQEGDVG